jgi:hypothetical protein
MSPRTVTLAAGAVVLLAGCASATKAPPSSPPSSGRAIAAQQYLAAVTTWNAASDAMNAAWNPLSSTAPWSAYVPAAQTYYAVGTTAVATIEAIHFPSGMAADAAAVIHADTTEQSETFAFIDSPTQSTWNAWDTTASVAASAVMRHDLGLPPPPSNTPLPSPSAASTPPASTPTPAMSGPIGTVYQWTDGSGNDVMNVTLTKIIPAANVAPYQSVDATTHIAAAVFTITGVTGIYTDDAYGWATAVGSDGVTYQPWIGQLTNCAPPGSDGSGSFTVTVGQSTHGCIGFQLPNNVKIAQVLWGTSYGPAPTIWVVP